MSARNDDRPLVVGKGSYWRVGKDGMTYQYRFSMGKDPDTGKYRLSPKRTIHCKSPRRREQLAEVMAAMEAYRQQLNSGPFDSRRDQTLGEYARAFHANREWTMKSPLAYDREGYDVRHIEEMLGGVQLRKLRPATSSRPTRRPEGPTGSARASSSAST